MNTWLKHITRLLSDEQVLAGYDRVVELYPHVPSLSIWRAWEYAAYQGRTLDQPVLDVGCGDGHWFQLVWPDVSDVYGIDMEPAVVERAIKSGVYRQVWQTDAAAMLVDPGMFGTVFANCSLEHMDNITTVMSNAWRALRPDGLFIFSVVTDKINDWFSPAALARALGEDALARSLYDEWLRYHHLVNPFPIEHWCEGLMNAGFEVVEHIPIIPEMTGRLFLLIDGLWHTQQNAVEIGDQLYPYLQQVPNFPAAFRGILQSALMMESHPQIGCGAVLVARKLNSWNK
jgi:SAM-dependent methyltransferase